MGGGVIAGIYLVLIILYSLNATVWTQHEQIRSLLNQATKLKIKKPVALGTSRNSI